MYLHLGQETVVRTDTIVGIFDLENTSISKITRDFLKKNEDAGRVFNVSYELPKSFVICEENGASTLYITQISSATLKKRSGFLGDIKNVRR